MASLQRFTYAWYGHSFLRELVLIYPTSALMMTGSGISPLELSTLFMVWGGAALLGEIPSGVIADMTSRRNVLVAAGLMNGSAFLVWLMFPGYVGFAIGFIIWGSASAMASGAGEALLYDSLRAAGKTEQFSRIYGRGRALNNLGIGAALLVGGFAAEGGFTLPLGLSIVVPWAAALLMLFAISEPPREPGAATPAGIFDTLRSASTELKHNEVVRFVVVMYGVLATLYGAIEEYFPLFFSDHGGLSLTSIGVIYALAYGTRTAGMEMAHRLQGPPVQTSIRLLLLAGLVLGISLLPTGWWLALPIAVYAGLCGAAEVLLQTRLQHGIEGPTRATVTSAAGIVEGLFEFPLYLSIGLMAQFGGWLAAFAMIAAMTLILTLGFRAFAPPEA